MPECISQNHTWQLLRSLALHTRASRNSRKPLMRTYAAHSPAYVHLIYFLYLSIRYNGFICICALLAGDSPTFFRLKWLHRWAVSSWWTSDDFRNENAAWLLYLWKYYIYLYIYLAACMYVRVYAYSLKGSMACNM